MMSPLPGSWPVLFCTEGNSLLLMDVNVVPCILMFLAQLPASRCPGLIVSAHGGEPLKNSKCGIAGVSSVFRNQEGGKGGAAGDSLRCLLPTADLL